MNFLFLDEFEMTLKHLNGFLGKENKLAVVNNDYEKKIALIDFSFILT